MWGRTTFRGGFCRPSPARFFVGTPTVSLSRNYEPPLYIDNGSWATATDDQGETPTCAGEATVGVVESLRWMYGDGPKQYSAMPVYEKAKQIDGDSAPGTTPQAAIEALFQLNYLVREETAVVKGVTVLEVKRMLHLYDMAVAALFIGPEWNELNGKGVIPLPNGGVGEGHMVRLYGYRDGRFLVKNSWRPWGFAIGTVEGFAWLPFEAFEKDCFECYAFGHARHVARVIG